MFIRTWTSLARGLDTESVCPSPPTHDRTVLRARSPPHVTFEHPVYSPSNLNGMPRPFVTRVYAVPPKLLAGIKSSCAPGVSTYCAVTAHLWRAMCVARCLAPDAESRLRVPATYCASLDLVTVRVGDVLSLPLGFVAERHFVEHAAGVCGGDAAPRRARGLLPARRAAAGDAEARRGRERRGCSPRLPARGEHGMRHGCFPLSYFFRGRPPPSACDIG
ncbi:hypothetical protein QYE76_034783 [Lolium multiflorum]|uniref:Uncharacterized protein n=1 Tax=Lolium multiflorum TaxID=4521 RepID=A0AAD8QZ97_LOLMU|nr:hypothetical protein QYE76_034783 [Lolium multiflorum]